MAEQVKLTKKTRKDVECPLFGAPKQINFNVLPTYKDIMRCYNFHRQFIMEANDNKFNPPANEIAGHVADDLDSVWNKASLPTVSKTRIIQMIIAYHGKCRNILKPFKQKQNDPSYKKKLLEFSIAAEILFDISTCKCANLDLCSCSKELKIPKNEHEFLVDQRTKRKMAIGPIDVEYSKKL